MKLYVIFVYSLFTQVFTLTFDYILHNKGLISNVVFAYLRLRSSIELPTELNT